MMHTHTSIGRKLLAAATAAAMVVASAPISAFAAPSGPIAAGTYTGDAALSCYVSAMNGVEFGGGGLFDDKITITSDGTGNTFATLNFSNGNLTIYGLEALTFIDATPNNPGNSRGITDGTIGIYEADGETLVTEGVTYTLSEETVANPDDEMVQYVNSITFPLTHMSDTYNLTFFINSQVMGVQFTMPNENATAGTYASTLTIDWDSLTLDDSSSVSNEGEDNTVQTSTVIYTVEGGYEVVIPASIQVDPSTKTGAYEVKAEDFVLESGAYVTVTADTAGTLSNGTVSLSFTNTLESKHLTQTGDTLAGLVTVTDSTTAPGTYTGTLDFTIRYFSPQP